MKPHECILWVANQRPERDIESVLEDMERLNETTKCKRLTLAFYALHIMATKQRFITMADVADHLAGHFGDWDSSTLVYVFRKSKRAGWIQPTNHFRTSNHRSGDAWRVRVWESSIVGHESSEGGAA